MCKVIDASGGGQRRGAHAIDSGDDFEVPHELCKKRISEVALGRLRVVPLLAARSESSTADTLGHMASQERTVC